MAVGHTEANLVPGTRPTLGCKLLERIQCKIAAAVTIQGRQPGQLDPISTPAIAGGPDRLKPQRSIAVDRSQQQGTTFLRPDRTQRAPQKRDASGIHPQDGWRIEATTDTLS